MPLVRDQSRLSGMSMFDKVLEISQNNEALNELDTELHTIT